MERSEFRIFELSRIVNESHRMTTTGPIFGSIRPPGSKSITNRALICAALAEGESRLTGALDSEDTRVMIGALQELGVDVRVSNHATQLDVRGSNGQFSSKVARLFLANSGTSIRFLTAMVALGYGEFELDGVERMRQRPIGDLVDALNQMGASVQSIEGNDCPPVRVKASGLAGGEISIRGDVSSQYLSAVMMVSPYANESVVVRLDGELVSKPYVEMTQEVMREFGVESTLQGQGESFSVSNAKRYKGREYEVEPDASAASYFWAAAAISGGDVTVEGLNTSSLQGDVGFCECLEAMGCRVVDGPTSRQVIGGPLKGIDIDMNTISDTVQTLAAVALFAEGPTRVRGVAHNRHKETDRIGDLATELRRLGATVNEFEDGLEIVPGPLHGCEIETYDDHRMAMSLALVGLRVPDVTILNPGCTEKTYPGFFKDLAKLSGAS